MINLDSFISKLTDDLYERYKYLVAQITVIKKEVEDMPTGLDQFKKINEFWRLSGEADGLYWQLKKIGQHLGHDKTAHQ